MNESQMVELAFEETAWKLQLEAHRMVMLLEKMRRDNLCMDLSGRYRDWVVIVKSTEHSREHGEDHQRESHGS